mmetsp:Transcript_82228/g.233130  ORF Transcript_82228/g.233130 Transcript_82228/m.233130 type:complete len:295 (+) Transcript_82228:297-1181(+)
MDSLRLPAFQTLAMDSKPHRRPRQTCCAFSPLSSCPQLSARQVRTMATTSFGSPPGPTSATIFRTLSMYLSRPALPFIRFTCWSMPSIRWPALVTMTLPMLPSFDQTGRGMRSRLLIRTSKEQSLPMEAKNSPSAAASAWFPCTPISEFPGTYSRTPNSPGSVPGIFCPRITSASITSPVFWLRARPKKFHRAMSGLAAATRHDLPASLMALNSSSLPSALRLTILIFAIGTSSATAMCCASISLQAVLDCLFSTTHWSVRSTSSAPPLPPSHMFTSTALDQGTVPMSAGVRDA